MWPNLWIFNLSVALSTVPATQWGLNKKVTCRTYGSGENVFGMQKHI